MIYKLGTNRDNEGVKSFVLSSDSLDRDFEKVVVSGISLKNFLKNPIMFFQHQQGSLPIGKWVDTKKEKTEQGNFLIAKPEFIDEDEESQIVKRFVDSGHLKAASIGFQPLELAYEDPPIELMDIIKRSTWSEKITVFKKIDLLEASIVTIGSNPDAIQKSISDNISQKDIKWLKEKLFNPHKQFFFMNEKAQMELFEEVPTFISDIKEIKDSLKSGAVLSQKNRSNLQKIIDLAGEIIADADKGKQEEPNYLDPKEVEIEEEKSIEVETIEVEPNILTYKELTNFIK